MDKKCDVCGKMYFAKRATSKFCSSACRVKYSRSQDIEDLNKKPKVISDKESYYTLKNFPSVRYTSSSNGGTLKRSPYPLSDKRSLAYIDKDTL